MRRSGIALAAAVGLAWGAPAHAAGGPTGIAFAQAEEGTWFCRDGDARKAMACALAKCAKGTSRRDCVATRWCAPAGWSGTMVAWLPEFHATVIICGTGGETAVLAGLKALCDATDEYTRCDFLSVIDPDGNTREISDVSWPGPATGGAPPAEEPAPASPPAQ
ncbi:MAG: hypothetical protein WDN31_12135 [Hyphomicrobium sp.]